MSEIGDWALNETLADLLTLAETLANGERLPAALLGDQGDALDEVVSVWLASAEIEP
jgi:hypothetical protein